MIDNLVSYTLILAIILIGLILLLSCGIVLASMYSAMTGGLCS